MLAAGQRVEIDAVARAVESELDALVHEPFAVHARADAGPVEQVDRRLLEHAGADAAEHVGRALPLEDHVVDAGPVQQLRQQQPRRAGADDRDLRAAHSSVRNCAWACSSAGRHLSTSSSMRTRAACTLTFIAATVSPRKFFSGTAIVRSPSSSSWSTVA